MRHSTVMQDPARTDCRIRIVNSILKDGDIFSADLTPQLQIPVRDWRVCLDTEYLSGRFEWVSIGSTIVRPDGCSTFGRRLEEQTCAVTSSLHPSFFTDIENRHSRAPGLPRAAVLGLDLLSMGTMWDGDVVRRQIPSRHNHVNAPSRCFHFFPCCFNDFGIFDVRDVD
jgi:hypothetical protein